MLERAVSSARSQSLDAIEIIVVDDGSSRIEPGILPQDRRIRLIRNERGRGASAARNCGVDSSRAGLVAFLDDDDEWLPGKLEAQLARLSEAAPSVVLVSCAYHVVSDITGEPLRFAEPPFDDAPGLLLRSTPFPTSVPLIRKDALETAGGFDESLEGSQDRDLWLRLRALGEFGFTPEAGVIKHNHDDQITTRLDLKRRALELFLHKHEALYRRQKSSWADQLARLGMMQCADGLRFRGALTLFRAAITNPQSGVWRDLGCQLFCSKRERDARIDRAFRQLDGALRYF